jgi:hypothetical protein
MELRRSQHVAAVSGPDVDTHFVVSGREISDSSAIDATDAFAYEVHPCPGARQRAS